MRWDFMDRIIVALAHRIFDGCMAIGTAFVYAQMIVLGLLFTGVFGLVVFYLGRLALGL